MHVKVFLATILGLVFLTFTGFATWLFPVVNNIHQQLGGQPLQDPRGSLRDQVDTWLSFLPSNSVERTQIVCFVIAAYLVLSSLITLIAVQIQTARSNNAALLLARGRTMRVLNARPVLTKWTPMTISNEYTRDANVSETGDSTRGTTVLESVSR